MAAKSSINTRIIGVTLRNVTRILAAPPGGLEPAVLPRKTPSAGGVTLPLVGSQVSSSAGTIGTTQAVTRALSGSQVATAAGIITTGQSVSRALSGSAVSADTGTITATVGVSLPLTGAVAAATAGNVSAIQQVSVSLSGAQITANAGIIVPTQGTNVSLSGESVSALAGTVTTAQAVSVPLSGAMVTALAGTLSSGTPASDPRLDSILAILMGTKIYDPISKLWRVYGTGGVEIADPSGILLRGLHGFILRQQSRTVREIEVDFSSRRGKNRKRIEEIKQILDEKREELDNELHFVESKKATAKAGTTKYFELAIYEKLLEEAKDAVEHQFDAEMQALRSIEYEFDPVSNAIIDRLDWQYGQAGPIAINAEELDISYVMMMILAEEA